MTGLDELMLQKLGPANGQGTMTVRSQDIARLKSSGSGWESKGLHGKLTITVEGVVFVLPDAYGT